MADRPVVIVSNRGPLSFKIGHYGVLVATRGAGGLVSGIGPLVVGTPTTWIAAALSPGDRDAAEGGVVEAEGFRVHMLALDPDDFGAAYDVVCNATLWFAYHGLFDLSRRPVFDRAWAGAWDAYRRVNTAFADAVAADAPDGAAVLVQDYHVALLGSLLAERRPDLRTVLFSHTPFPGPEELRVLPLDVRTELLGGMAAHHACGFHTHRWAGAFAACCHADLGVVPATFVSPLGPEPADIGAVAGSAACARELADLDRQLDGRKLVARVDRIELSKNLLRGFAAYDDLLTHHPEWRERVVFGAFVYPSREGLEEYHGYRRQVEGVVADLNRRWSTPAWEPVLFDASDHFARSVAALRRSDVLLVNPIRDGLNLVAKEGPLVNDRHGVLLLSPEAGAWEELGDAAIGVHPYDVVGTAEAMHRALSMGAGERAAHAEALRAVATARTPADWLADQLAAAG